MTCHYTVSIPNEEKMTWETRGGTIKDSHHAIGSWLYSHGGHCCSPGRRVSMHVHACVSSYICPLCLSRDRCGWSRLPTMPQTGPILSNFVSCWCFFFSSLVFSPACVWRTWTSKVTVLECMAPFEEASSHSKQAWLSSQSSSGFRQAEAWDVFPRRCARISGGLVFRGRGMRGGWTPFFFVVGEEGCAEAKWHSEAFVFGSDSHFLSGDIMREAGSDVRFWPHMATGRPTDGSACSQSLTSLTSTKRQNQTAVLSAEG